MAYEDRGSHKGVIVSDRLGEPLKSESERFMKCPACDGWFDTRDLAQIMEHEGPLPHRKLDRPH